MAKRYSSKVGEGAYAGIDAKRTQEMQDAGMIREDRSAIANLPQNVMMKEYPKPGYASYGLDDTIKSVDNQMEKDLRGGKKKSGPFPEMY